MTDIKANYPDIWEAGGNIRGNDAYRLWTMYLDGDKTEVLDWVVEREGLGRPSLGGLRTSRRHGQLGWGVIGSRAGTTRRRSSRPRPRPTLKGGGRQRRRGLEEARKPRPPAPTRRDCRTLNPPPPNPPSPTCLRSTSEERRPRPPPTLELPASRGEDRHDPGSRSRPSSTPLL